MSPIQHCRTLSNGREKIQSNLNFYNHRSQKRYQTVRFDCGPRKEAPCHGYRTTRPKTKQSSLLNIARKLKRKNWEFQRETPNHRPCLFILIAALSEFRI